MKVMKKSNAVYKRIDQGKMLGHREGACLEHQKGGWGS